MNWCNCNFDNFCSDPLSNINELGYEGHISCYQCGGKINHNDVILLLIKEVKRLGDFINDLEFEKIKQEGIKMKEEEEERLSIEKITAESERFNILDL